MDSKAAPIVPRYVQVADRIQQDLGDGTYLPGERLPAEEALAGAFGISRGTLRKALGELSRRALVETIPGRGTFVKLAPPVAEADDGRGRLVGMVIPAVARMRIPELIAGAEGELRAAGYTLLLGSSGDDQGREAEQVRRFVQDGVSGLLVYPVDGVSNVPLLRRLASEVLPIVLIDRYLVDLPIDAVVPDNLGGAFLAVRRLVECGHQRIGFVSTHNLGTSSIAERQAGYRWALEQHGRTLDVRLVCTGLERLFHWPAPRSLEAEHNQALLQRYLAGADRPEAVFAVNDTVAFQVLEAARRAGLRVPEDLALTGFDNLAYPDYGGVLLTTVEQPRQEIGATAARVLLERIRGRRDRAARVVLATRLIVRRSSGEDYRPEVQDRAESDLVAIAGT